jgi:hypothetical protein
MTMSTRTARPERKGVTGLAAEIGKARENLRVLTAAHDRMFQIGEAGWHMDQDLGTILFISPTGLRAEAPVQIIGTFNTQDGTWLWGWDHPSVPEPFGREALRVREFGQRYGLSRYVSQPIRCTEDEAWQFTALACHLAGSSGAYRGPFASAAMFMTFGDVTIHEMR